MDSRTTIYISCHPEQFSTLLSLVKTEVKRLAYHPVCIADCPADLGEQERLAWIETQIQQSLGVLHFPGSQFGERIENHPGIVLPHNASLCSVHHFEVLCALKKSKPLWVILPEKGCTHDPHPIDSDEHRNAQKAFVDYLRAEGLIQKRAKTDQDFQELLTKHYYEPDHCEPDGLNRRNARKSVNITKRQALIARVRGLAIAALVISLIGFGLFQHAGKSTDETPPVHDPAIEINKRNTASKPTDFQTAHALADNGETPIDPASAFTHITYAICELQMQILAGQPPLSSWSPDQREKELVKLMGWSVKPWNDAMLLSATSDIRRAQALLINNQRDHAAKEFEAIIAANPNEHDTALAHLGKAIIAQDRGNHQDALEWFQKNAATMDRNASPMLWASAHHPVAFQLAVLGRFDESEKLLREILETITINESDKRCGAAGIQRTLTRVLLATSRADEALPIMEKVLAGDVKTFGSDHSVVALDHQLLASLHDALANHQQAESHFRSALAIAESHYGKSSSQLLTTLTTMAEFLHKRGKLTEAEPIYRRALLIHDQMSDPHSVTHASMLGNLAGLLFTLQRTGEAEVLFLQSIERFEKLNGSSFTLRNAVLTNYARLLDHQGRTEKAISTIQRVIATIEISLGNNHPKIVDSLLVYANYLQKYQQPAKAELQLRRALAIDVNTYGDYHPNTARDLEQIADFLIAQGRAAKAEGAVLHALEIREINDGKAHPHYAANLTRMATILAATNRRHQAAERSRDALVIYATLRRNSDDYDERLAQVIAQYRELIPKDKLDAELAKIAAESGWSDEGWKKIISESDNASTTQQPR